jgi:uncharacterized protein (TIGR02594 family)
MIHNTRLMLALGCVALTALSIPAVSTPNPRGMEQQVRVVIPRDPPPNATRQAPVYRPNVAPRPQANASPVPRTEQSKPLFGWPKLISEARKYIGTNPTDMNRRWCARFLNLVLAKTGYAGTGSDAARSFASYGEKISQPKVGAIAVLSRGRNQSQGHVGIITGLDARGNPIIISGNHGHRVGESSYPRSRVIAYVMPTTRGNAPVLGRFVTPQPVRLAQRPTATAVPTVVARRPAPAQIASRQEEPRRIVQQTAAMQSQAQVPAQPPRQQLGANEKPAFVAKLESDIGKLFTR